MTFSIPSGMDIFLLGADLGQWIVASGFQKRSAQLKARPRFAAPGSSGAQKVSPVETMLCSATTSLAAMMLAELLAPGTQSMRSGLDASKVAWRQLVAVIKSHGTCEELKHSI